VNPARVDLEALTEKDEEIIQRLVRRHREYTRSERAETVLRKWNTYAPKFVKVFPRDLKMALDARLESASGDG
jgi:glutamate synthase domain-containing protein 3